MKNILLTLGFLIGSLSYAATPAKPATKQTAPAAKAAPAPVAKPAQSPGKGVILTKDNTITLNDEFYGETVAKLAKQAKELDSRTESSDPIYLVLNSPGGSIDAGLELIENLNSLRRPVKTITVFSASMGFQTVQGVNGERLVVRDGTLMSHKARGGFYGEFPGQLDTRYNYYLKRVTRMDQQAVKRTNGKHTLQSYHNLIENEYWCDGQDCVDEGFADRVVQASCDKSLEGVRSVSLWQDLFMGHTIEVTADYDLCPVNTNMLKYTILIDGQPLFQDRTKKEEKKETASGTTNPQLMPGLYGPYYGYNYNSSSYDSDKPSVSKEELFEIQKKVNQIIRDRQERKVIKGY